MPASATSNSGAVCESNASSKPRGAKSRAIAPASGDGGTRTIFAITTSPSGRNASSGATPKDYALIPLVHANSTGLAGLSSMQKETNARGVAGSEARGEGPSPVHPTVAGPRALAAADASALGSRSPNCDITRSSPNALPCRPVTRQSDRSTSEDRRARGDRGEAIWNTVAGLLAKAEREADRKAEFRAAKASGSTRARRFRAPGRMEAPNVRFGHDLKELCRYARVQSEAGLTKAGERPGSEARCAFPQVGAGDAASALCFLKEPWRTHVGPRLTRRGLALQFIDLPLYLAERDSARIGEPNLRHLTHRATKLDHGEQLAGIRVENRGAGRAHCGAIGENNLIQTGTTCPSATQGI